MRESFFQPPPSVPSSERLDHGEWKRHDRTHIELISRHVRPEQEPSAGQRLATGVRSDRQLELYVFIPQSLHVDAYYGRDRAFADVQSYSRLDAQPVSLESLAAELETLSDRTEHCQELHLFACSARQTIIEGLAKIRATAPETDASRRLLGVHIASYIRHLRRLTDAIDHWVTTRPLHDEAHLLAEDLAQTVEGALVRLARFCGGRQELKSLERRATEAAVRVARLRQRADLGPIGFAGMPERHAEHLEYRRHALKRFTSSTLWLKRTLLKRPQWIQHTLYSIAASVAMAFAIAAALYNGTEIDPNRIGTWGAIAVLAYAVKDRIKATLQSIFSAQLENRIPDRRWRLQQDEQEVAMIDERLHFTTADRVPGAVTACRNAGAFSDAVIEARPESILHYEKAIRPRALGEGEHAEALLDIVRIDIGGWLSHTDDAIRRISYVDPDTGSVETTVAPRVYNLSLVYRWTDATTPDAPFQRTRIVVSRRGIVRVEPIEDSEESRDESAATLRPPASNSPNTVRTLPDTAVSINR